MKKGPWPAPVTVHWAEKLLWAHIQWNLNCLRTEVLDVAQTTLSAKPPSTSMAPKDRDGHSRAGPIKAEEGYGQLLAA